jgi:hypothetical protein
VGHAAELNLCALIKGHCNAFLLPYEAQPAKWRHSLATEVFDLALSTTVKKIDFNIIACKHALSLLMFG